METNDPQNPEKTETPDAQEQQAGPSKPLTVVLGEELVKKLKIVALMKDISISALIETYVSKAVKTDIKKAIGKLEA